MNEAFNRYPFLRPHCHREMDLGEIWHADYGFLYHYMEGMEIIKIRGESANDTINKERDELSKEFLQSL